MILKKNNYLLTMMKAKKQTFKSVVDFSIKRIRPKVFLVHSFTIDKAIQTLSINNGKCSNDLRKVFQACKQNLKLSGNERFFCIINKNKFQYVLTKGSHGARFRTKKHKTNVILSIKHES